MRIIQYKRLLEKCPDGYNLCWFCLETHLKKVSHDCGKVLKNINEIIKSQTEILSNFEEMINRYKYVKKIVYEEPKESRLKIKIQLDSNCIYVNNVIVKYTDELFIDNVVEAVFLATRKKADSRRYTSVVVTIETASDTEDDRTQCLEFLENNNLIEKLPQRIFKEGEDITVIFH
jgi:sugar-specific transcriptional regulator TrmB